MTCRVVMTVANRRAPNSFISIRIKICATQKKKEGGKRGKQKRQKKKVTDRESHTNSETSAP